MHAQRGLWSWFVSVFVSVCLFCNGTTKYQHQQGSCYNGLILKKGAFLQNYCIQKVWDEKQVNELISILALGYWVHTQLIWVLWRHHKLQQRASTVSHDA